jgi:demethylmenaquinone methyltransferase/2-methoxy-6-polyprenyl-1,4-benzoquinol methylase
VAVVNASTASTTLLPTAEDKARVVESMFDRIAPRYDLLNRLLTFRMDVGWRNRAVAALRAEPGGRVLDIACGTGDLCRTLAEQHLAPIGVDFSVGMLRAARTNAPLLRADALNLPFPDAHFDGMTCGFALRNFTNLEPMLREAHRVLRPGTRVALLDVGEPANPVARAVHAFWFRHAVPAVGGLLSDKAAYRYLPASTAYLPPTADLLALLGSAGFVDVTWRALGFGAAQLIVARRP